MAAKLNTTIRRWCETCGRFTRSEMKTLPGYGAIEVCAEHVEPEPYEDE
jgi:hypothetical protein